MSIIGLKCSRMQKKKIPAEITIKAVIAQMSGLLTYCYHILFYSPVKKACFNSTVYVQNLKFNVISICLLNRQCNLITTSLLYHFVAFQLHFKALQLLFELFFNFFLFI